MRQPATKKPLRLFIDKKVKFILMTQQMMAVKNHRSGETKGGCPKIIVSLSPSKVDSLIVNISTSLK